MSIIALPLIPLNEYAGIFYQGANVAVALLVAGRLSDHVGRRPVLLAVTAAQAVTMLIFMQADSTSTLLVARLIQGLVTGTAVAAAGAGMLDIDKRAGGVGNSVAPQAGTALGGVLGGLFVQYLPAPTLLVYVVLAGVYVAQLAGVACMSETTSGRNGAWKSLAPTLALPAAARLPVLLALPTLVAIWALAGFYASLGPKLMRSITTEHAVVLGGFALFVFSAAGATSGLLSQRLSAARLMTISPIALLAGLGMLAAAIAQSSVNMFMLGSAVLGAGFGTGFQGAIRSVVAQAGAQERAGVLSVLFIVSYLSMGVPSILAGYRLASSGDIRGTAEEFGIAMLVLAMAAMAARLRSPR